MSGKWNRRDKLESSNQICYVYNSPIMLSDVIGLAEENFCCPNKIVVNFTRSLKISTEELKELDDSLKKEWENYMRVHHKNAKVKDEALTKKGRREMKDIPYPVAVSDKGIANEVEGEPINGYWGKIWLGTLTLKCAKSSREYNVQSGGRAKDFNGNHQYGTTAPKSGKGFVQPFIKTTGSIAGFRIYQIPPKGKNKNVRAWYDNRFDLLIHLAPLFIPAHGDKEEIRQTGSHGCVSLHTLEDWESLKGNITKCNADIPIEIKGIAGYPV